jgi:hypothetical protein
MEKDIFENEEFKKVIDEYLLRKQIINLIAVETEYGNKDLEAVLTSIEDVIKDYREEMEEESD